MSASSPGSSSSWTPVKGWAEASTPPMPSMDWVICIICIICAMGLLNPMGIMPPWAPG